RSCSEWNAAAEVCIEAVEGDDRILMTSHPSIDGGCNMKRAPATELAGFRDFIGELLKNGSADLLPEQALEAWREQHPDPLDFEDDLTAIKAALDDRARGEKGTPLEE